MSGGKVRNSRRGKWITESKITNNNRDKEKLECKKCTARNNVARQRESDAQTSVTNRDVVSLRTFNIGVACA